MHIAPNLLEARCLVDHCASLLSGVDFNVDPQRELNGVCDFLFSRSPVVSVGYGMRFYQ